MVVVNGREGERTNCPSIFSPQVLWINESTNERAVFAGAMPTMAAVKLTTGRPIVNHPHYEDAGIRWAGQGEGPSSRLSNFYTTVSWLYE